ncbi:MAG TPA: hypothetical protein VLA91_04455 [Acidimicrobiia bacterium]|nr:hypothetical protein [Acidimicrobiia bacterium]
MAVTVSRPGQNLRRPPVVSGGSPPGKRRRFEGWLVTAFTTLVLIVFLMPMGYMAVTSLKSEQQLANLTGPILPMSPAKFEYEGRQLDMMTVPMPDGSEMELAMLQPGRQVSQFIDPANPDAGPIQWEGNWRILKSAYELDPQWQNFPRAWENMKFPLLLRNTLISLERLLRADDLSLGPGRRPADLGGSAHLQHAL